MRFTVKGIGRSGKERIVTQTDSARVARGIARAGNTPLERSVVCDASGAEISAPDLDRLAEGEEARNR